MDVKINHYTVDVANEYRDAIIEVLDDYGFDATKQLHFDDNISSVEIGIPGASKKLVSTYYTRIKFACPLIKYLFVRASVALLKIPKDKVTFTEVA